MWFTLVCTLLLVSNCHDLIGSIVHFTLAEELVERSGVSGGGGSSSHVQTYGMKDVIDMVETLKTLFTELEQKVATIEAVQEEQKFHGITRLTTDLSSLKTRMDSFEGKKFVIGQEMKELETKLANLAQMDETVQDRFANSEKVILDRIMGVQSEIIAQRNWTATIFNDYCKIMLKPNDENKIYALTEVYEFCVQKVNFTHNST